MSNNNTLWIEIIIIIIYRIGNHISLRHWIGRQPALMDIEAFWAELLLNFILSLFKAWHWAHYLFLFVCFVLFCVSRSRLNTGFKVGVGSLSLMSLCFNSIITFQHIVIQLVWKNKILLHLSVALYLDHHRIFLANHSNLREHLLLFAALCCGS